MEIYMKPIMMCDFAKVLIYSKYVAKVKILIHIRNPLM